MLATSIEVFNRSFVLVVFSYSCFSNGCIQFDGWSFNGVLWVFFEPLLLMGVC